jgi:nucleotide-binding universal stress UspA family protein
VRLTSKLLHEALSGGRTGVISVILVPTDGSACAMQALAYACDLSKIVGARVEACHAIDYLSLPGKLGNSPESAPDVLVEEGEAILSKARAVGRKHGIKLSGHLIRGNGAEAIVERARESQANLIVMGTHGRTGLRRIVLGSVAEGVIRRTHLPVLLLRNES